MTLVIFPTFSVSVWLLLFYTTLLVLFSPFILLVVVLLPSHLPLLLLRRIYSIPMESV
jgi:hypothetical protein